MTGTTTGVAGTGIDDLSFRAGVEALGNEDLSRLFSLHGITIATTMQANSTMTPIASRIMRSNLVRGGDDDEEEELVEDEEVVASLGPLTILG